MMGEANLRIGAGTNKEEVMGTDSNGTFCQSAVNGGDMGEKGVKRHGEVLDVDNAATTAGVGMRCVTPPCQRESMARTQPTVRCMSAGREKRDGDGSV
jgi:hypothetical protein